MANNYLLFSTAIPVTDEEKAWLEDNLVESSDVVNASQERSVFAKDYGEESFPDFSWKFDEYDGFWMHADESGNVEHVVTVVRALLKHFKSDKVFTLEWAVTCSKPRLDQFGGGAVVVTRKKTVWLNTGMWAGKQAERLSKKRKNK